MLVVGPGLDGAAKTMLVDAGGPVGQHGVVEVASSYDIGEEVVSPYLWSRRLRRVDVVVLTHAHTDNMGGMPAVLRNFRPRELWVGIDPGSELYKALLVEAAQLHVVVRHLHAGERFAWGASTISVLAPSASYNNAFSPKNDDSVVLEIGFGKAAVLLEGDAERASEEAMLAAHRVLPATLLKVGHHGSMTLYQPGFPGCGGAARCRHKCRQGKHVWASAGGDCRTNSGYGRGGVSHRPRWVDYLLAEQGWGYRGASLASVSSGFVVDFRFLWSMMAGFVVNVWWSCGFLNHESIRNDAFGFLGT